MEANMDKEMKDIGKILDDVSTKVPTLISGIMNSLYSAESGANTGKAAGNFYKELLEAGIPKEDALQMTKDYVASLGSIVNNQKQGASGIYKFDL
jgi:hypothetical protein